MSNKLNSTKTPLSWSNWYHVISIRHLASLIFLLITLMCVTTIYFITTDTNIGLKQSTENLQFAKQSKQSINEITNGVIPALIHLEQISVLTRDYLHEVRLIAIDSDYSSLHLMKIVSDMSNEIKKLEDNKNIKISNGIIAGLKETSLVVQDIASEVVESKSIDDLQQLLLDSEDINLELLEKTNNLRTLLLTKADITSLTTNKNASFAISNEKNLNQLLSSIDSISLWMLTGLLGVILLSGLFLYKLAFTRLGMMEHYAKRIADGELTADIEYYSNDNIGNTGHAISEMGNMLSSLLVEAQEKAELAQVAQEKAEQQSWLNESLRLLSEINRGETDINKIGINTVKFISAIGELQRAGLYVLEDSELKLIGDYQSKFEHLTTEEKNEIIESSEENIYTLIYSKEMIGVLKLTFFTQPTEIQKIFYKQAASQIAVYLHAADQALTHEALVIEREKSKALELLSDKMDAAKTAAEEAALSKSSFLANMSHEIRTPLTAIIGFSELLEDPNISKNERIDSVQRVTRAGKHLLQLINDILDISKIEANQLSIEQVSINLFDLLVNVEEILLQQTLDKGLSFSIDYVDPLPLEFESDPLRLKQILINLCSNAIKFTEKGGVNLKVSYESKDELLVFDVIDTGIGMTPEKQSSLFTAFYQGDPNTTRKYGGSGLGLYLSKQLAEKLGGSISAESESGVGSHFTAKVHIRVLEHPDFTQDTPGVSALSPVLISNKDKVIQGKVLLAEDNQDNQDLISLFLSRMGLETTVVENGQLAMEKALEEKFDLVLMDMQMPVMDGLEATKALRDKGYSGSIVALSANAMKKDVDAFIEAGCDEYLTKPIEYTRLSETLTKYF